MKINKEEMAITKLFKPYIVKRSGGQCQILFALTELDALVGNIIQILKEKK